MKGDINADLCDDAGVNVKNVKEDAIYQPEKDKSIPHEDRILMLLRRRREFFTARQIGRKTNMSYSSAVKTLGMLRGEDKIYYDRNQNAYAIEWDLRTPEKKIADCLLEVERQKAILKDLDVELQYTLTFDAFLI